MSRSDDSERPLPGGRVDLLVKAGDRMRSAVGPALGIGGRALVLVVVLGFIHVFSVMVATQVVRSNPSLLRGHGRVAALLCGGGGASLGIDFGRAGNGRRRGLDEWIRCRGPDGVEWAGAGRRAVWLSGLVLSLPLGILALILLGRLGQRARQPAGAQDMSRPIGRGERIALLVTALLVSLVLAFSTASLVLQVNRETIAASPRMGRLLCGDGLRVQVVRGRGRRVACVDRLGQEVGGPNNDVLLRFSLPFILVFALPALVMALRLKGAPKPPSGDGRDRRGDADPI